VITRRVAKRIWDAKTAAEAINSFTDGMNSDAFFASKLVQAAVERQFEIIGEALNAVRLDDPTAAEAIPLLSRWVGFRNFLAHRYDDVRDDILFRIIETDLPGLLDALEHLLSQSEPP